MALFEVVDIINSRTIQVEGWRAGDSYRGSLVNVQGYEVPIHYEEYAKNKLKLLLENKSVELKNILSYIKGEEEGNDIVLCRVFLNEIDISTYFQELKSLVKSS